MAVVADASALALDGVIDAAFAGKTAEVETRIRQGARRRLVAGSDRLGALRQVANLHKMRLAVDGGDSIEFAMMRGAPPVHFSREKDVGAALRGMDAGAAAARHGAARGRFARHAPQLRAGGGDRAAHVAVAGGERAEKGELDFHPFAPAKAGTKLIRNSRLRGNERSLLRHFYKFN